MTNKQWRSLKAKPGDLFWTTRDLGTWPRDRDGDLCTWYDIPIKTRAADIIMLVKQPSDWDADPGMILCYVVRLAQYCAAYVDAIECIK